MDVCISNLFDFGTFKTEHEEPKKAYSICN